jgi:hypothetical protein
MHALFDHKGGAALPNERHRHLVALVTRRLHFIRFRQRLTAALLHLPALQVLPQRRSKPCAPQLSLGLPSVAEIGRLSGWWLIHDTFDVGCPFD